MNAIAARKKKTTQKVLIEKVFGARTTEQMRAEVKFAGALARGGLKTWGDHIRKLKRRGELVKVAF